MPIEFSQLSVHFNLKEYDQYAIINTPEQLKFQPDEEKVLSFNFSPQTEHAQRTIEVRKNEIIQTSDNDVLF